jgi:hypothetical protein
VSSLQVIPGPEYITQLASNTSEHAGGSGHPAGVGHGAGVLKKPSLHPQLEQLVLQPLLFVLQLVHLIFVFEQAII